jgi:hypothetical protein
VSVARSFPAATVDYGNYLFLKDKYEPVIKAAKEEWMLSTDGVVRGLHYDPDKKGSISRFTTSEMDR